MFYFFMLIKSSYGNHKLHEHILHKCLFPFLEKTIANCDSGLAYSISPETKVYRNGSIVVNPDVLVQTSRKDLVFEVKSSRDEKAWMGAVKQCEKCAKHYLDQIKDFNFYLVRPAERATNIVGVSNLEISLMYNQGDELVLERAIPMLG